MRMMRVLKPVSMCLATLVVLAGAVNLVWVLRATYKHGGALDGFVRAGHYYLAQRGSYTEVSRAIWEDMRLHEQALPLGAPLVIACIAYILLAGVFPYYMRLRRGEAVNERVRAIQASGRLRARAKCAGIVGLVRLGVPRALAVGLYPAGLTLRVVLEPTVAIRKEELTRVAMPKGFFQPYLKIEHRSPDVQSPLELVVSGTSDFAMALGRFMESTETRAG